MYPIKLLLVLLSIAAISCDKKEPEPPESPQLTPMTTTGEETLSFLKDGEVWIADQDALSPVASISIGSKQFAISCRKRWDPNQSELFGWSFPLSDFAQGEYLGLATGDGAGFFPSVDNSEYCNPIWAPSAEYLSFGIDESDTFNRVNITRIDWSGNFNIIAGTFQFRLTNVENDECQDTIYITQGRFDLEFEVKP